MPESAADLSVWDIDDINLWRDTVRSTLDYLEQKAQDRRRLEALLPTLSGFGPFKAAVAAAYGREAAIYEDVVAFIVLNWLSK